MENKYLIVCAVGGLCNKLRTVFPVYVYCCKFLNRKFIFDWGDRGNCLDMHIHLFENNPEWIDRPDIQNASIFKLKGTDFIDVEYMKSNNEDILSYTSYNMLPLETIHIDVDEYKRFINNEVILKRDIVEKTFDFKGERILGVHIRRTDHNPSITYSPDRLFIEKINSEIEKYPNLKVFLASDNPETKKKFKGIYKDKLIVYENIIHSRSSVRNNMPYADGHKDALRELFTFKQCYKVLGSFKSSYSEFVSNFYGVELVIVKNEI